MRLFDFLPTIKDSQFLEIEEMCGEERERSPIFKGYMCDFNPKYRDMIKMYISSVFFWDDGSVHILIKHITQADTEETTEVECITGLDEEETEDEW